MDFKMYYEIEIRGLINTIQDYTREHYINNYTNLLKNLYWLDDKERIKEICLRLKEWYVVNITDIENNQFIHNLHEHKKSEALLELIINELKVIT